MLLEDFFWQIGSWRHSRYFQELQFEYVPFWPQALSFECREVRKRKNEQYSYCPFCVRISFYRDVDYYVIKKCVLVHEGHIINESSI